MNLIVQRKHNYFYKITNLINGKYYYGIRSIDRLPDNFYMGSGRLLKHAIKKHGIKNFIKEIIADYPTRKEASDHERQVVTMELVLDENCYNLKTGGDNEYTHSDETKQKISLSHKGKKLTENHIQSLNNSKIGISRSNETKQKISNSLKGRSPSTETKEKIRKANTGRKHTNETIEKIRKLNIGQCRLDETKQKISNSLKGRSLSPEHIANISRSHLGKKLSESCKEAIRYANRDKSKPCIIDDVFYRSIGDASRILNITKRIVSNRLNSSNPKWNNWIYDNK